MWYGSVCDSPLVVSLAKGPHRFCGEGQSILFDLDANGQLDFVTWTVADSEIAFVTLDLNGNGTIDSGAELFGNHMKKKDGSTAANGFDALADFDDNNDGVIDATDVVWSRLRLWVARNHDGFNEPTEMSTPAEANITAFGLDHHFTARYDRFGNTLRFKGEIVQDDHPQPYYDVYFRMLQ